MTDTASIDQIVDFWLQEVGEKGWYERSDALDDTIRDRFRATWDKAAELAPEVHTQPSTPVKVACAIVMEGFLLLGLLRLLRRRRLADDGDPLPREMSLLVWGSMAALGLIVLVPNLSVDYGVLRAFQQTMLVVAPVMAAGMWMVVRKRVLAAVVPVALLVVLAGTQERIALGSSGSYYDRFYVTDAEMGGLTWLGEVDHADRTNERLIANRNLNVRLLALSGNRAPISDRLYPTLLSRDAYVFVDGQILDRPSAPSRSPGPAARGSGQHAALAPFPASLGSRSPAGRAAPNQWRTGHESPETWHRSGRQPATVGGAGVPRL